MPDSNKLKVLIDIGYTLALGCNECQYGRFAPQANFGQCRKHQYVHAKHTPKEPRNLSVHRAGRCPDFEANAKKMADVERSGFERFFKTEVKDCDHWWHREDSMLSHCPGCKQG